MAENKKGFILYADLIHTIEKMPIEKAGELFLHILNYVNDKNPISEDLIVNLTFEPIKQQLKRDLNHWESIKSKRSDAGRAGANKRWQNIANDSKGIQTIAKIAVTDNVKVNVINIEERKLKFAHTLNPFVEKYGKEMIRAFYDYWTEPNKSNTKFRMELEKTWGLEKRLGTWAKNENNFKPKNALPNNINSGLI